MDREKLASACAAIEAFFTAEERAIMEHSEGYVLGVIESLGDEIENPDPSDEDQPGPTDDIHSSPEDWWWLAVNGPSCAACGFPVQAERLKVQPVPEQMIGFRTREEQFAAQKFLITAPIKKVTEYMASLPSRIDAGEVAYIRPSNPEPPTRGATVWSIAPKQDVSLNEQRP
jgi:hypothetical protein